MPSPARNHRIPLLPLSSDIRDLLDVFQAFDGSTGRIGGQSEALRGKVESTGSRSPRVQQRQQTRASTGLKATLGRSGREGGTNDESWRGALLKVIFKAWI